MPLFSALEDLKVTTLRSVAGLLARLDYLSSLRSENGMYEHWGFRRIHGDPAAQQALSEAHRATLSGILRTPLRRMLQDAEISTATKNEDAVRYMSDLSRRSGSLLPGNAGAGSERHLSAVLHALEKLLKTR
jgi:hypothetical protein